MPTVRDIVDLVEGAIEKFNTRIPTLQRHLLEDLLEDLRDLDLRGRNIKTTVKNLRKINSIKGKLQRIILNKDYKKALREYVKVFSDVTKLQNQIFNEAEDNFSPPKLGKELKRQAIDDVVTKMTETGITGNIGNAIADILRQNITTGSSYASLTKSLREMLTETKTPGLLQRYARQITTDAVNQYTATYMKTVSAGIGYEWFRYSGKDISTTRPFCDAMTDRKYFHISEVPDLLKAKDLYYTDKDGSTVKVPLMKKTGLPAGMIPGTDSDSFFSNRGGYNCGHQIFPTQERLVPLETRDRVFSTAAYKRWKAA